MNGFSGRSPSGRGGRGGRGGITRAGRASGGGRGGSSRVGQSGNKDKKQNRRRKAEQGTNRKLEADANFFCECVSKRDRGMDIAGVSGKPWHRPTRAELFGVARDENGINESTATDEAEVT